MRCLLTIALLALCFSFAVAQNADGDDAQDNASAKAAAAKVQVEYFPCDANDPLDLKDPGLVDQLIDYGIAVDPTDKEQDIIGSLLTMSREKPVEAKAFAVRITNNGPKAIAINPKTIVLALAKYDGGDMSSRSVAKRVDASPVSAWAGRKSLLGKKTLAPKANAVGVVYFEVASDDLAGGEIPEVEYVAGEGAEVAGKPNEHLLPAVGLEWKVPLAVGAPAPSGKPRIYPTRGNTKDNTPFNPGTPGALEAALPFGKAVVAHKNVIGEQTQMQGGMQGPGMMGPGMQGPGMMGPGMMGPGMMGPGMMGPGMMGPEMGMPGMGMPGMGMPGMGMPGMGMPGMGMPGMGMPGGGGMMPGMPGGGMGMPGGGGMMPGMPGGGMMPGMGMPGAMPGAMPGVGMPGAMPGMGMPGAMPGAMPTMPGGRR